MKYMKNVLLILMFVLLVFPIAGCAERATEIVDNTKSAVIGTVDKVLGNETVDQETIDRENAIEVAKAFVKESYSLYDRKGPEDIGGFEYAHPGLREKARSKVEKWQKDYFEKFDHEMLPEVLSVSVKGVEKKNFKGNDGNNYKYYSMYVVVEFNKNRDHWEENVVPIGVVFQNNVWQVERKGNDITQDQMVFK